MSVAMLAVGATGLLIGLVAGAIAALVAVAVPLARKYDALESVVADLEAEVRHVVW